MGATFSSFALIITSASFREPAGAIIAFIPAFAAISTASGKGKNPPSLAITTFSIASFP